MIRADAPPIAPASAFSAKCTSPASAGISPATRCRAAARIRQRRVGPLGAEEAARAARSRSGSDAVPFQTWTPRPSSPAEHIDESRRLRLLGHALPVSTETTT